MVILTTYVGSQT